MRRGGNTDNGSIATILNFCNAHRHEMLVGRIGPGDLAFEVVCVCISLVD